MDPVFAVYAISAFTLNLSYQVFGVVNLLMEDAPTKAVPDTTPVNQYSHFYEYVVENWDKLDKLYEHFETLIPGFALLVNALGNYVFFRTVFLKFFDKSGLKLLAMKSIIRLAIFGAQLFEKIRCLLRG